MQRYTLDDPPGQAAKLPPVERLREHWDRPETLERVKAAAVAAMEQRMDVPTSPARLSQADPTPGTHRYLGRSLAEIEVAMSLEGARGDEIRTRAVELKYDGAQERWERDAELQAEFDCFDSYSAYCKAWSKGCVFGQPTVAGQRG